MTERRHRLTPQVAQEICAFIRAGGYPKVAAQASGIPPRVFALWLKRGLRKDAREPYRSFAEAVRQAEAQARVGAEMAAYKKDALNWLKGGPGRDQAGSPGWAMPVRASEPNEATPNSLSQPEAARLIAVLIEALTPFPEARAAAAAALDGLGEEPAPPSAKE
ncbi:MAG: hypothetical protein IT429_22230 [Gemmataceae bacterium]|nr:hypothetical protein [Gemmataceae bacterium]